MKPGRSKMLLLFALFLAPPLAAVLLYFVVPQWIPSSTTNYGHLIAPSRVLPTLTLVDASGAAAPALGDKWTLVYVGGTRCDETCLDRLYLVRQLRKALDKDSLRVQRLYIAPDRAAASAAREQLAAQHHDLLIYADEGTGAGRAAMFFQSGDPNAVFLVDPVGNWMMLYSDALVPGGALTPKGMYKDLKKLLRTSHIG